MDSRDSRNSRDSRDIRDSRDSRGSRGGVVVGVAVGVVVGVVVVKISVAIAHDQRPCANIFVLEPPTCHPVNEIRQKERRSVLGIVVVVVVAAGLGAGPIHLP